MSIRSVIWETAKPTTWKFIKQLCDKCEEENIDLPIDSKVNIRKKSVSKKYSEWKQNNNERELYHRLFNDNALDIVLKQNDFPYNFEEGVAHYVVWLKPDQTRYNFYPRIDINLLDYVANELNKIYDNFELIHFRNKPNGRTIRTIDHYHILIKIN